ncbi:MAG TPA: helix-turn-helix domain-containing protein [Spirochaetota bacterium]|nr:helix-turn-helix domain-containing protein [Spirochaetota bacterium]HOK93354.1 helix-turn-helix domain-containing protein [Spirochaetota bacterium]HPP96149.1 helix-turn-helix domain-containing protein [Spirochaetota bacterium]
MEKSILYFLMFFGPTFAVVISIGQIVQAKKALIDYLFAASFFGMALWMYQICFLSTDILYLNEYAFIYIALFPLPLIYIIPPIMVMRYKWVLSSSFDINKTHIAIFLPSLVCIGWILYGSIRGITFDSAYYCAFPLIGSKFATLPLYFKITYIIIILPNLYVATLMSPVLIKMLPVWQRYRNNQISKAARMGYISALSIAMTNILCFMGYIFSLRLVHISVLLANCATIYVYLVTQRHPHYHRLLRSETRKAHYERSRTKGLDVNKILQRLKELMEEEKIFADEELTLKDLASELAISQHQLSQILNENLKKNFNTFINEYRIEEAKKMLIEEKERSILSIGIAVGFNSNTAFTTVFSKITGITPSQYRKQNS